MAGANGGLPTPRLGGFNSNFAPIPELEDVDAELEQNARAAAEEEAYKYPFSVLCDFSRFLLR